MSIHTRAYNLGLQGIDMIYLAGPMTGLPGFNYPAFHAAANRLRECGFTVLNPAERFGGDTTLPREKYMRADLADVLSADAVAFLSGWQDSMGARLEYDVASAIRTLRLDAETLEEI